MPDERNDGCVSCCVCEWSLHYHGLLCLFSANAGCSFEAQTLGCLLDELFIPAAKPRNRRHKQGIGYAFINFVEVGTVTWWHGSQVVCTFISGIVIAELYTGPVYMTRSNFPFLSSMS